MLKVKKFLHYCWLKPFFISIRGRYYQLVNKKIWRLKFVQNDLYFISNASTPTQHLPHNTQKIMLDKDSLFIFMKTPFRLKPLLKPTESECSMSSLVNTRISSHTLIILFFFGCKSEFGFLTFMTCVPAYNLWLLTWIHFSVSN